MPEYNINDLLKKYNKGTLLPEEKDFLDTWYAGWMPEPQKISELELEQAKARVWAAVAPRAHFIRPWHWFSAAAAVFLIALLWTLGVHSGTEQRQMLTQRILTDFKPGKNKAVLTLANGEEVTLEGNQSGSIARQGGTLISQATAGKLVYGKSGTGKSAKLLMNSITTPRGGEYQLVLSDGTKVWLNAASSISFPVAFTGDQRTVTLTGEAYFEVAHDKSRPFIVSTAGQQIAVLGTHFNVSAYPDDDFTSTSLISGLVRVKNLSSGNVQLIQPGQGATTTAHDTHIDVHAINADEVISWKNGYFQFDNQSIYSIMKIMGRWYNVDVEYANVKNAERFGGTFSRGKNLSESLANLEKLGDIHFKLTAKKIIVTD